MLFRPILLILLISSAPIVLACIPTESPDNDMDMYDMPYSEPTTVVTISTTSTTTSTDSTTTTAPLCPSDWVHYADSCYFFEPMFFLQAESEMMCQTKAMDDGLGTNGHLTTVENAAEQMFLDSMLFEYWIGLKYTAGTPGTPGTYNPSDYSWEDGSTPGSWSNWYAGPPQEPNNPGNAFGQCVNSVDGSGWVDNPCTVKFPYVCKSPTF